MSEARRRTSTHGTPNRTPQSVRDAWTVAGYPAPNEYPDMVTPVRHWWTVVCITLTGVLLVMAAYVWAYGWFGPPSWRLNYGDLTIYTDATRRLLAGGSWYTERQLHGPYPIEFGDVLYPPVSAFFFAPWLVLPGWTFVVIPGAIVAWVVYRHRPAMWAWPLIALCLLWPMSGLKTLSANPNTWVAAAVALGTVYGWPAAFVLLKPSFLPLALFGIRDRRWWIVAGALAVLSLPLPAMTLEYPRVVLDAQGGGIGYSLPDLPFVLIPVIAWAARSSRGASRERAEPRP